MEPCGIGCNFMELDSMAIPIQNGENNPMHSRIAIDYKGEFSPSWPGLSRPSTPLVRGEKNVDARDKPRA